MANNDPNTHGCDYNPNFVSDYIDPWWKFDLGKMLGLDTALGTYYGVHQWYTYSF